MCMSANQGVTAGAGETALGALLTATGYGSSIGVPLIIGGIGSAAAGAAQQNQLNKQDQITAQGIIQQGQLQRQGEGDVQQSINTVAQSNASAAAKSAQQLASFQKALQQAAPISQSDSPTVPGSSKAYAATQKSASGSAQDYANAIANSAAVTQGTQLERIDEGNTLAGTASQLGVLSNTSNEDNYVTQLKVRATQQNPWLNAFGQVMQGASRGYASGAFSGAPATQTPGTGVTQGLNSWTNATTNGLAANAGTNLPVANGVF